MLLRSFGYLHGQPPEGGRVVDVRERLADPAGYRAVLELLEHGPVDGRDARVQAIVLADPDAPGLLAELVAYVLASDGGSLSIGCSQGHDRSVALVELCAAEVRSAGQPVTVEHRDVNRPRMR